MEDSKPVASPSGPRRAILRLAIVVAGILFGQFVLYGPSLVGQRVLLPLDILAKRDVYLPNTVPNFGELVHDDTWSDLVYIEEPSRRFAISELRAGRWPRWAPHQFAGARFIWPVYSPYSLLRCSTESPLILPWVQMTAALVAGIGMYLFLRRAAAVGFWPAAIGAWCYPLTAFFTLWQGFPVGTTAGWLPWMFLAIHRAVRLADLAALAGVGLVTGLVLVTGQLDVAGQVLLLSGLYALWCFREFHRESWLGPRARKAVLVLVAGWVLGFQLAAPYVLPLLEYTRTGARMERRRSGTEERPPTGLAALPQVVLPDLYGSTTLGSAPILPRGVGNVMESSSAAYGGLLVALCLAPLAWSLRGRRALASFLAFLALFALSWCLAVPGIVQLLRLPGLNMMSHNRLVFAAGFAITCLGALGLEALLQNRFRWRQWMWVPAGLLAAMGAWCYFRGTILPEPVATQIESVLGKKQDSLWWRDLDDVRRIQAWFVQHYMASAVLCALGVAFWALLKWKGKLHSRWLPALSAILIGDLLWFGHGRSAQCDPALYYPPIPALQAVASSAPGRIIGNGCLPPALAEMCGLRDIRGYDAVDPARLMAVLSITAAEFASTILSYAQTQWLAPTRTYSRQTGIQLSPLLDMLAVRYMIFRGEPPAGVRTAFQSTDYWVLENARALPRAFVPRRVETVTDDKARLQKLALPEFDPRDVAYLETPMTLGEPARGTAHIVEEVPTRIGVSVQMETPGVVVLADLWDDGWHAYSNGNEVPVLRANHAIRAVAVPAGVSVLEFRYEPASFTWGLRMSAFAALVLAACAVTAFRRRTPA